MNSEKLLSKITPGDKYELDFKDRWPFTAIVATRRGGEIFHTTPRGFSTADTIDTVWKRLENQPLLTTLNNLSKFHDLLREHAEMLDMLKTIEYNLTYCRQHYNRDTISDREKAIEPISDLIKRIGEEL